MSPHAYLSSKLGQIAQDGFAVHQSRQAGYQFKWHLHDCAMLLWPQSGGLNMSWLDTGRDLLCDAQAVRLTRHAAILLPPMTAHQTSSVTTRQHHAELYLAPGLLKDCGRYGPVLLDGATVAMLDALAAPSLAPGAAPRLVGALVAQLASSRPLPLPVLAASLPQKMMQRLSQALQSDTAVPSVDAVAAGLGVSTRQLQRACQQELGMTPVAARRRLVAAQARRLMAEDGLSLARTSEQLGFASSGHLNRLLRAVEAGPH